ncbi:hypothetical protein ScPMuIL_016006 [Solemya velum]
MAHVDDTGCLDVQLYVPTQDGVYTAPTVDWERDSSRQRYSVNCGSPPLKHCTNKHGFRKMKANCCKPYESVVVNGIVRGINPNITTVVTANSDPNNEIQAVCQGLLASVPLIYSLTVGGVSHLASEKQLPSDSCSSFESVDMGQKQREDPVIARVIHLVTSSFHPRGKNLNAE